jgi:hypothetical protein
MSKMGLEDIFSGAKTGVTFYGAFFGAVAQKYGMEEALALDRKTFEAMGAMQGKMFKEQMGIEEAGIKEALALNKATLDSLGIPYEVMEESPTHAIWRCNRCSVYEGNLMAGLDHETTKALCASGAAGFQKAAFKALNPKLNYELKSFRSSSDDFCEEEVVLQ